MLKIGNSRERKIIENFIDTNFR